MICIINSDTISGIVKPSSAAQLNFLCVCCKMPSIHPRRSLKEITTLKLDLTGKNYLRNNFIRSVYIFTSSAGVSKYKEGVYAGLYFINAITKCFLQLFSLTENATGYCMHIFLVSCILPACRFYSDRLQKDDFICSKSHKINILGHQYKRE